jgi:hypothetical protein
LPLNSLRRPLTSEIRYCAAIIGNHFPWQVFLATPAVQGDFGMVIADHINPLTSGGVCDLPKMLAARSRQN